MSEGRRINIEAFKKILDELSPDELLRQNDEDFNRSQHEHAIFSEAYKKGICYLCSKPLKTISKETPCVHWLLRQCKFRKKDFPLIYSRFGYRQIAAFTRWAANEERFLGNINDLVRESTDRKIFEHTIKWKNIEWTFDCSKNDYKGHDGMHSNYPHYHFQMRIDGKPFINFGDFHIPFSEEDIFFFDLEAAYPEEIYTGFGVAGMGMQTAAEMDPEEILKNAQVAPDEENATFRMQTLICASERPIDGQVLQDMIKESQATGETLASLAQKHMAASDVLIKTVITPADSVPAIAHRTQRVGR